MMAVMKISMVEEFSGAMYHSMTCHLRPPRHQVKNDNIGFVEVERLERKVIQLLVEDGATIAMGTWRIVCNYPIFLQLPCVDSPREICLLYYYKVYIFLKYPAQGGFKSAITPIVDII